jgi:Tol biopolymer transport system component
VFTLSVRQGVWVAKADGSDVRSLALGSGGAINIYWSSWSPDSSTLAFVRSCCEDPQTYRKQTDLWVVNADGTDARQLTTSHRVVSARPIWSPTGTAIAYVDTEVAPTPASVMAIDLTPSGSTPRLITRAGSVLAWGLRSRS